MFLVCQHTLVPSLYSHHSQSDYFWPLVSRPLLLFDCSPLSIVYPCWDLPGHHPDTIRLLKYTVPLHPYFLSLLSTYLDSKRKIRVTNTLHLCDRVSLSKPLFVNSYTPISLSYSVKTFATKLNINHPSFFLSTLWRLFPTMTFA